MNLVHETVVNSFYGSHSRCCGCKWSIKINSNDKCLQIILGSKHPVIISQERINVSRRCGCNVCETCAFLNALPSPLTPSPIKSLFSLCICRANQRRRKMYEQMCLTSGGGTQRDRCYAAPNEKCAQETNTVLSIHIMNKQTAHTCYEVLYEYICHARVWVCVLSLRRWTHRHSIRLRNRLTYVNIDNSTVGATQNSSSTLGWCWCWWRTYVFSYEEAIVVVWPCRCTSNEHRYAALSLYFIFFVFYIDHIQMRNMRANTYTHVRAAIRRRRLSWSSMLLLPLLSLS